MKRFPFTATVSAIIVSLLMISCAASKHPGITHVEKPLMEETNEGIWYNYWQDQFDAFNGNVISPSSTEYQQGAVHGYQRAKMEWDGKVAQAGLNTSIILYGGLGVASLLLSLIVAGAL